MTRKRLAPLSLLCTATVLLATSDSAATPDRCDFDKKNLQFKGTPEEQARCLLRPVKKGAKLGPTLEALPPTLASLVGQPVTLSKEAVRKVLASQGLSEADVGGSLDRPVSQAKGGDATAPLARYFVIHDTSDPWFADGIPADADTSALVNDLTRFQKPEPVAHLFISRRGQLFVGHTFDTPWRATKREKAIGEAAKGLFLHIESVQPRTRDPIDKKNPKNDLIAPENGLTEAQYSRLALLYVVASIRAGTGLIPAFHAALDEGIKDAHDDPQNFELAKFEAALQSLITSLGTP